MGNPPGYVTFHCKIVYKCLKVQVTRAVEWVYRHGWCHQSPATSASVQEYMGMWVCPAERQGGRTKEKFPKQLKSHLRLTSHEVLMVPIVIWIGVASDYTMFKLIYFDSTKIFWTSVYVIKVTSLNLNSHRSSRRERKASVNRMISVR